MPDSAKKKMSTVATPECSTVTISGDGSHMKDNSDEKPNSYSKVTTDHEMNLIRSTPVLKKNEANESWG